MKRLWEVDHPYYCNESNYFSNGCYEKYEEWSYFMDAEGDADIDMNLIFRWDWSEENSSYNGDDNYRNGTLKLFYIGQRKGLFRCVEVAVCRNDESAVIEFLKPRLERIKELWEPLI